MAEDSTRRLLKTFGVAVTNLEDALEAGEVDAREEGVGRAARADEGDHRAGRASSPSAPTKL